MAVISQGLVPKAMAGGLAGSPASSAVAAGRQRAARPPSAKRLLSIVRLAGGGKLAAHNCGGTAFHNGSGMAHPVGRR
jgi:hypothetical protein